MIANDETWIFEKDVENHLIRSKIEITFNIKVMNARCQCVGPRNT